MPGGSTLKRLTVKERLALRVVVMDFLDRNDADRVKRRGLAETRREAEQLLYILVSALEKLI